MAVSGSQDDAPFAVDSPFPLLYEGKTLGMVGDIGFEPTTSCVSNTAEGYHESPLSDDQYAFVLVLLEKVGNEVL